MKAVGYDVREGDPFAQQQRVPTITPGIPPIAGRLQAVWETHRAVVADTSVSPPGLPADRGAYLKFVDDIYQNAAYHSLAIEGYSVTPEPGVRAVLGHWPFGYIHPYLDGNGRMARFLMNAILHQAAMRGPSCGSRIAPLYGGSGKRGRR